MSKPKLEFYPNFVLYEQPGWIGETNAAFQRCPAAGTSPVPPHFFTCLATAVRCSVAHISQTTPSTRLRYEITAALCTLTTTLKSLDYNVVMTFRFNNNNNKRRRRSGDEQETADLELTQQRDCTIAQVEYRVVVWDRYFLFCTSATL